MFDALGTGAVRAPEHDDAQPRLGRLLVDRGHLTEGQLQYALAEQGRTGLPIGQVLISLSYVTASTIAQALATQEGGVVRTEFGLSTGFGTPGLVALPPVSPPASASAPTWTQQAEVILLSEPKQEAPVLAPVAPALPDPELLAANARIGELEQELASAAVASAEELSAARTRVAELEHESFGLRQQAEAAQAAAARVAELEAEMDAARTAASDRIQALEIERDARVAELQQTHAQLASTTENLRAAYERLHQFEIAQALQQPPQTRAASPFAWQS